MGRRREETTEERMGTIQEMTAERGYKWRGSGAGWLMER